MNIEEEEKTMNFLKGMVAEGKRLLAAATPGVAYYAFDRDRVNKLKSVVTYISSLKADRRGAEESTEAWVKKYQVERDNVLVERDNVRELKKKLANMRVLLNRKMK